MRMKLVTKLFLINAGIIFALTSVFIGLSYSTSKGMYSNALNGIDIDVMKDLSKTLEQHYKKNQSWDAFVNSSDRWKGIADDTFFTVFFSHMNRISGVPLSEQPPVKDEEGGNPDWEFPFGTFYQRLSLLDADKKNIIEAEILNSNASYRRIRVGREVVGWIRVGKINVDQLPLAQYFFDQQLRIVYWASGFGALVAVILSFALSRQITAPIRQLTLGARQIAQRNFKSTIHIKTGDELQDLADSFNVISQELSQYQDLQKKWLMNISHELRSPLTLLVGEVYAVCDNLSKCDDTTAAFLQQQANHVKHIADDLYQLCQMDEIGIHLSEKCTDLKEVVTYHVHRYADRFKGQDIAVHEEYPQDAIYVSLDSNRFGQVLGNIFDNCLRYTRAPGSVWIRVKDDAGRVEVEIEDSGPGVPELSLINLFERRFRIDSDNTRVSGGAGLGLTICKEIVVAHGGSIVAGSGKMGGLCLTIVLSKSTGGIVRQQHD